METLLFARGRSLGLELSPSLVVVSVDRGSQAEEAGVVVGWKLAELDGIRLVDQATLRNGLASGGPDFMRVGFQTSISSTPEPYAAPMAMAVAVAVPASASVALSEVVIARALPAKGNLKSGAGAEKGNASLSREGGALDDDMEALRQALEASVETATREQRSRSNAGQEVEEDQTKAAMLESTSAYVCAPVRLSVSSHTPLFGYRFADNLLVKGLRNEEQGNFSLSYSDYRDSVKAYLQVD